MAHWDTVATWVGPTVNEGDGDGRPGEPEDRMTGHVGMVIHIAEGTYAGTEAWEHNPAAEVSSHFIVAKDGRCAQMVDTDDRSWCQADGNTSWISVENEGYHTEALTPEQVEANARLYARCMDVYGAPGRLTDWPSVGGLGWHGMGGQDWGGHYDCPGELIKAQRTAILVRAMQILHPPPPPPRRRIHFAIEEGHAMPEYLIKHDDHPEVFAAYPSGLVRHIGPAEWALFTAPQVAADPDSAPKVPTIYTADKDEYDRLLMYTRALQA